jgi:hypothetical protein
VPPAPTDGAPPFAAPEPPGAPALLPALLLDDEQPSKVRVSTEKQLLTSDERLGMATS